MTVKIQVLNGKFVTDERTFNQGEIAEVSDKYFKNNEKGILAHQHYGSLKILEQTAAKKVEESIAEPKEEIVLEEPKETRKVSKKKKGKK